ERMLKAAYKKTFGTDVNCIVQFNEDETDVEVYSRKVIVDGVYDPVTEIDLEEAKELSEDVEIGDEIDISIDPKKDFEIGAVQTGKQKAQQTLSEIQKNSLLAEYKDKVGEIIIGYYQREKNENIYVDLGKVEGILPKKFQSPRENFVKNDRIKAIITEIRSNKTGLQIVLSRTSPDFVREILELEVPEIYEKTVEINKIVREAGYRTKIAVSTGKAGLDPVGSCVGQKGVRIQSVIKELEGEKIDVLRYDPDPKEYIKNALSPAEVTAVVIKDEAMKTALAIVPENQLSLAIGKQGLNVRLANRLTDWMIDVKTEDQVEDIDSILAESRKAAQDLFTNDETCEAVKLSEIEGIEQRLLDLLAENNIFTVEDFDNANADGRLNAVEGLSEEDVQAVDAAIGEWENSFDEGAEKASEAEVPAEENAASEIAEDDENVEYECPECGAKVTIDMTVCPNCGVGLSFEFEDEE
ncbi:MAG: transcription termination factor NusA, partial [Treponemataceae bacterium]|nr:transcription termination factor NusA [Treponemataceae bacterium]